MKTIFVDIDTQYDFIMPDGKLYVKGAERLIPNFSKLMELAEKYDIRVLSSADAHTPDDPEFAIFPPHCIKGEPGWEKIPETLLRDCEHLENRKGALNGNDSQQIVIEKSEFSMFTNPNTDSLLMKLNPKRAVIYGVATDYCVKAAAMALQDRGYETYVVFDAICPVDPEKGKEAIREMELAGIIFVTTDSVEALIKESLNE